MTWVMFFLVVVGLPITFISLIIFALIWTHHLRKMEALRVQSKRLMTEDIRSELASLRQEIRELRDTSMQYDLSFDTAMQQMERRVLQLEREKYNPAEVETQQNVRLNTR